MLSYISIEKIIYIKKNIVHKIITLIWSNVPNENEKVWTDRITTSQQNQELLFIPTNEISDTIYYVSEDNNNNQRLIVDIPNYSIENWTPNTSIT